jgi:phage terminase large subunit-like protein
VVFDPAKTAGDCYYDEESAALAVDFFAEMLCHTKGPLVGKPFILEPWQEDVTRSLFGWKRPDGTRRFRRSYITIPRKNGKSTWAAGLALYALFADGEGGAECYCAATEREQASLVFNVAAGMVRKNDKLYPASKIIDSQKRIVYKESFLRAIPANESAAHGFNCHCVIGDELHAWVGRSMYDVLITGSGARSQPLIVWITTAGYDRHSICWTEYTYARKIRDGQIDDPAYLPVIYEATEGDDWKDPDVWRKANPNFGISIREDYIAQEAKRAEEEPSYQNTFRRLHLNQWTSQKVRWFRMDDWRDCPCTNEPLTPKELTYGGLDLASTTDLTAWCVLQKNAAGAYRARWQFWIPEDRMRHVERTDRVPYAQWLREGWVNVIPGARINQDAIEKVIVEDAKRFDLKLVGYDPWNAEGLTVRLDEKHGIDVVKIRQGYASLSAPSKELEAAVLAKTIDHGGNPVVEWMIENVEAQTDINGNIRPVRPEHGASGKKIDGVVALILAIAVALTAPEKRPSVYETRGPLLV